MIRKLNLMFIGIIALITSCRDSTVDKSTLRGYDFRLYQDTPAWELAKAVQDENTDKIKDQISKDKSLLKAREPRFGQTLLQMAVLNRKYNSTKSLLELGADPNMQDLYEGTPPMMEAADIGNHYDGTDPRFLKLLLEFGGDPNKAENISKAKRTPLLIACGHGNIDYAKILIEAGAQINTANQIDSPLSSAIIAAQLYRYPEIVIYLIEKGANFKGVFYQTNGQDKYITNALREWRFNLGSNEYKKKMQLVELFKKNGMDYWKTPIPEEFLNDYSKEYLSKY